MPNGDQLPIPGPFGRWWWMCLRDLGSA